jgi:predicted AAA+ superfamily ATPase
MLNIMKRDALLNILGEWLEEWEMPSLIPRHQRTMDLENLRQILAIVGPRRAGKTYFMYQLIQPLLQGGRYSKKNILFIDF